MKYTGGFGWTDHLTPGNAMDFDLSDEQRLLRESVDRLIQDRCGFEPRRGCRAEAGGWSRAIWAQFAELGLLGLPFAEEDGGFGAGPVEVAIVAEEIGRVLAPEPFIETVVLAGGLVAAVGTADQKGEILGGISEGTTIAVFAHAEPGTRWSPTAEGVTATESADGWTLTGVK